MDILNFLKESIKDFKRPINIIFLGLGLYPIVSLKFPVIGFSLNPMYIFSFCWFFTIIAYVFNTFRIKNKYERQIADLEERTLLILEIIQYRNNRYWEIFNGNPIWQGNQPKVFDSNAEFHKEKDYIKEKLQERFGNKWKVKELEDLISQLYID